MMATMTTTTSKETFDEDLFSLVFDVSPKLGRSRDLETLERLLERLDFDDLDCNDE